MKVSRELENIPLTDTITVGRYEIKKLEQFKYLGTIVVTQRNECQIEIQQRINMGNKCVYALHNLLSSKVLRKKMQKFSYT